MDQNNSRLDKNTTKFWKEGKSGMENQILPTVRGLR